MSGPTFLTNAYDRSSLDPRTFESHFSDEVMSEVWGDRISTALESIVWMPEYHHNGWLRGVSRFPAYFNEADLVYLPRFARLVEQRVAANLLCVGRTIRVMPIVHGNAWAWQRDSALYMCELPVVRQNGQMLGSNQASIGQDIYDDLVLVADACLSYIYDEGAANYRTFGSWNGLLQLAWVDQSYKELPSFYTAVVGSIIEAKLQERADSRYETVRCMGWDARDTLVSTRINMARDPWVAYRIDPVQIIIS